MISIIIPCLNEESNIQATLDCLQPMRQRGHQVIVVDGGSGDASVALADSLADEVLLTSAGRGRQMNAGANFALGDILWFIHADTRVPADLDLHLQKTLAESGRFWGRFDVRLSGNNMSFRIIAALMNWRSRLTGIATGDQGMFVCRKQWQQAGGFADIPLMEDIELSKRLKKSFGQPLCLSRKLLTSSRRWESHGLIKTTILMWHLRLRYALGADPSDLSRHYQ